ncbi:activity-dependent neuroprotector homeobox protein 2b [Fundulus diaphanus]
MYQFPVGSVDKIRKARKAVKNILSEIGLEDCQNWLKELDENPEEKNPDPEEAFQETEWIDMTDGFSIRQQKKWPYRTRPLCCTLCKYSSQNIYNFRSHVSRCHAYVQSYCALTPCSQCVFISHPKIVKKHMLFFHAKLPVPNIQVQKETVFTHRSAERFQCRRCGFPSSSIFAMKKHIILKHLEHLAEQYVGYRLHQQTNSTIKIYCCKVCKVNTGTLDQMLHHMLVEPSHHSVNTQVQTLITENKNYAVKAPANGNGLLVTFPNIAPKPQTAQIFSSSSLVLPSNGQPAGTVVAVQQLQGNTNSATLICAPGTNQTFLPPQASALVQLASAEAKGLLQPGATIALRSALPQGSSVVQLPTVSNVSLKQTPASLPSTVAQPQQALQGQQMVLPPAPQASQAPGAAPKPAVAVQNAPINHTPLQGTMMTSQSLLSHLIPTGNRMNGMPTYTFAPLVPPRTSSPLKPVEQLSNAAPQTKRWITCPLCNELFPSNVFDMHTEAAHQTKSATSRSESVAARASFLRKMPDKTVKCLTCKMLLTEKTVFQHLLHGLNCLYCSALFFSVKQLVEHVKLHNPASKVFCDFLRQKYRIYSKGNGGILFPHFDVSTTAPKEVLGEGEVNIALVTNSLDLIYFKLQSSNQQDVCLAPMKLHSAYCPFCSERFHNQADQVLHLKQKHFVAPTIHAILKTEAFKCIYCNGVYTGKVTQQAVMLHIQRCRYSPKPPPPPPPPPPPKPTAPTAVLQHQPLRPPQQVGQQSGLYFLQMPQGMTMTRTLTPARLIRAPAPPPVEPPETEAERQLKRKLEAALKEAMEANRREREERAALRKKREQERREREKELQVKKAPPPEPETQSDPSVKLALEPTSVERRGSEERREFISKYFNANPYVTKPETEELCRRLSISRSELAGHFSKKRSKCMKSLKRSSAAILLGFNMAELSRVKHNLVIPEPEPPADAVESDEEGEPQAPPPPTTGAEADLEPMDVNEAEQDEPME